MAIGSFQLYPEYLYFTGVEISLTIEDKDGGHHSFTVSKIDDNQTHSSGEQGYLQSLMIKEGMVGNSNQQVVNPNVGGGIASGTVSLIDKNNAIFLSLLASKSKEGKQLLNRLDIYLKTYTGPKSYKNCRINKWTCNFNGGVPIISLEWQSIGGDNSPAFADSNVPSFDPNKAKIELIDRGVVGFGEFIRVMKSIYNNTITFKYSTSTTIDQNTLQELTDSGSLRYYKDGVLTSGNIIIPKDCLTPSSQDRNTYRMKLNSINESLSFLTNAMKEICSIAKIENTDLHINWRLLYGNTIFIYTYKDMGSIAIPEDDSVTQQALENSVFIYNSSFPQGGLYTTPQGSKVAFSIDSIGSSFDFSQVLVANVNEDSNKVCPNGNMFVTSRGAIMLPPSVPAQVQKTIKEIENLNLSQNFTVRITVYNFAHFYVLGQTLVDLVVFDHMGNIHPITGKMRITGYQYDIGSSGVIKADVTLAPPFSQTDTSFTGTTPTVPPETGDENDVGGDTGVYEAGVAGGVYEKGNPDITPTSYPGTSGGSDEPLPSFLGISVKKLFSEPEGHYIQGRVPLDKPPKWIVVHYTGSKMSTGKEIASGFAKQKTKMNKGEPYREASSNFGCGTDGVYMIVDEKHKAIHVENNTKGLTKSLTNKKIYDSACGGGPLSYKNQEAWRYDMPSHNHLIWGQLDGLVIDDKYGNPFKDVGDISKKGDVNRYAFGVDLCDYRTKTDKRHFEDSVSKSDWTLYPEGVENGAKLVAYLCYKYNIPVARVLRHGDVTGKACLPIFNTEIYTPFGYKSLDSVKKGDIVYQYNPKLNKLEETKILSFVSPYMATVCKNRDYEVTLNHRTIYKDNDGSIKTEPFGCVLGKEVLLFTMYNNIIKADYSISKDFSFYDTLVSCIEVESSYIVVRQNGVTFITGNCPRPYVSLPSDSDKKNDTKWKRLLDKNTGNFIEPDDYARITYGDDRLDFSYTYDPRKHILDLEENIPNPENRTSFLGKVAGYLEMIKVEGITYTGTSGTIKTKNSDSENTSKNTMDNTQQSSSGGSSSSESASLLSDNMTSNQVVNVKSGITVTNLLSSNQIKTALSDNNKEKGLGYSNQRKFRADWVGRLYSIFNINSPSDHYFTENLVQAIASFQKENSLTINGIIDENTRIQLERTYSVLFDQLLGVHLEPRTLIPAKTSIEKRYAYYKAIILAQGGVFKEDGTPNILGIRGVTKNKDGSVVQTQIYKDTHFYSGNGVDKSKQKRWDDTIITLWIKDSTYHVKEFKGNADPCSKGFYNHDTEGYGTAHLRDGQYEYTIGMHNGYKALVNASTIEIIRHKNRKSSIITLTEEDFNESVKQIRKRYVAMVSPNTAVHIHKAPDAYTSSQGCQNIVESQWQDFLSDLINIKGKMFYTLIDASKINVTL